MKHYLALFGLIHLQFANAAVEVNDNLVLSAAETFCLPRSAATDAGGVTAADFVETRPGLDLADAHPGLNTDG